MTSPGDVPPFEVFPPVGAETPVVVEVPHAGTHVPLAYLPQMVAPARALGRDADLLVDQLYAEAPLEGATLLVARHSRYVVDLNRSEDDVDAGTLQGAAGPPRLAHGLLWRQTTEGARALARPLHRDELEARLTAIYRPYHQALWEILEAKRARFGRVVLLAAHSMPSTGRTGHGGSGGRDGHDVPRADVVPGTRGRTTAAAALIDCVEAQAKAAGFSVRHDDPYRGGFTTQHYGRPAEGIHVVQVELARRLYMDEETLAPHGEAFAAVRGFCRRLVGALAAEIQALPVPSEGPASRRA